MGPLLLIARLLLAAVFLVAGIAKLADRDGSREAMKAFGMPDALARPSALLLPLVEIAVGAGLVVQETAAAAAGLGALLLLSFAGGIARAVARGERPDCHCFGQVRSSPAGWSTFARNVALAVVALFVAVAALDDPGTSPYGWIGGLTTTAAVLLGVAVAAAAAAIAIAVHLTPERATSPAPAVAVGAPAPSVVLTDVDGEDIPIAAGTPHGRLVVLWSPKCADCGRMLPDLRAWSERDATGPELVLVANTARYRDDERGIRGRVVLDPLFQIGRSLGAFGTPTAVLVGPDGRIAAKPAEGAEAVLALANAAGARSEPTGS